LVSYDNCLHPQSPSLGEVDQRVTLHPCWCHPDSTHHEVVYVFPIKNKRRVRKDSWIQSCQDHNSAYIPFLWFVLCLTVS
jgi:hypothetical protein